MNLTKIIRPYFRRRIDALQALIGHTEQVQRDVLRRLLEKGQHTKWGRQHRFGSIKSYEDYAESVPVTPYDELRPTVMRMIAGESDVLWPGATRNFAQSSGTSDGKSKYIPITADSFRLNHYRGSADVVAHYLNLNPSSRIFSGKGLILGGSFANELNLPSGSKAKVGDLSANLIMNINPIANLWRTPSKKIALMADWNKKLPAIARAAMNSDITNISGVPSWFYTVLSEILRLSGAEHIHDVWPNLEVFFHGGISMAPYRGLYDGIIDHSRMHYIETYNASEGFFAVQDTLESGAMRILLDGGAFFEFIPAARANAKPIPAWEVEQGKIYALVLTSCNGLWRYPLGDTVKIVSTDPLRIVIAGRTKHFINAFGEEVMVHNTDAALAKACRECGCKALNYTAAPVYTSKGERGHHQWLIEFAVPPADTDAFAATLDRRLMDENSDYQAKRQGNIFLDPLTVTTARQGLFDRWLASTGKLGGQRKVPRLSNDRKLIDEMLRINNEY